MTPNGTFKELHLFLGVIFLLVIFIIFAQSSPSNRTTFRYSQLANIQQHTGNTFSCNQTKHEDVMCFKENEVKTNLSPRMNRMVFTHVGKAGGSYVNNVMKQLQSRNNFEVVQGALLNGSGFMPRKERLFADIKSLGNNTIYENHANYVQGLEDREWISMVRDPLALMNSHFYYAVDTHLRGGNAYKVLEVRKRDKVCGCFNLEFDECIDTKFKHNCTINLPQQMSYFCEPRDPGCTLDSALRNVENYLLIGITEEMALAMKMLEILSPWAFTGQGDEGVVISKRGTQVFNPVTNTSLNGAISTRTRTQIKERAHMYNDEIQFYNAIKRMFWKKAVELGAI